jgi:hypothetical protein
MSSVFTATSRSTTREAAMEAASPGYPATFTFDPPEKVANWRAIANWILAIPHFIVLYGLRVLSQVLALVSWFMIVITGEMPEGIANIQAMYMRYEMRVYPYGLFMREEYPPFAFGTTQTDDGLDPRVSVNFVPQLQNRNRLTVAFRLILVIPHLVVLGLLAIAAYVVTVIAFFAVLFTGRWPVGMRDFVLNVYRWYLRVSAYFLLLVDDYPPFALS